ncbi:hypothetical protein GUITHDRAFT_144654 [Guillardia theta CCMP2712]|uniref:Uncharacterized protein n=1 Tax=Guillardia theta (strain CCMP2712) TaxID=905079 RepID=L1IPH7_GUITC|nr:hypothetical protein GUITHDRAFT_144654 [Guillardia theta CCMP2712]EKX37982.1 hypothetical protein GUITHDRAFT_144654 [Guillardia theta CCMP2712]|eukprot:XP_005824962.1 hypothetical protein GUITHDRAFT_144654 [Guillardia theta CCMP2712]
MYPLGALHGRERPAEATAVTIPDTCDLPRLSDLSGPFIYFSLHEIAHLRDVDMILRINLNDYTYWCIPFGRTNNDCDGNTRTVIEPRSLSAADVQDGSCRELLLGTRGYLLAFSSAPCTTGFKLQLSNICMIQSSNLSLPCAVCRTTIHSSGEFCQSKNELQLREIFSNFKPTYVENFLNFSFENANGRPDAAAAADCGQ